MGYLSCPVCDKTPFSDVREFQQHIALSLRKPHSCPICSAQIAGLEALYSHLSNHLPETKDVLKLSDDNLNESEQSPFSRAANPRSVDNSTVSKNIGQNEKLWNQNSYSPECISSFDKLEINDEIQTLEGNIGHLSGYVDQSPSSSSYSCSISRSTSQKSLYDDSSCMSESPCGSSTSVSCHICGLVFSSDHFLSLHKEVIHSDDNNFEVSCKHCNSKYKDLEAYRNHIREDHSERQYICEKCPKSFKMKGSLVVHTSMFHDPSCPSTCSYCKKRFSSKARKDLHERRIHGHNKRQENHIIPSQLIQSNIEDNKALPNIMSEISTLSTAKTIKLPPSGSIKSHQDLKNKQLDRKDQVKRPRSGDFDHNIVLQSHKDHNLKSQNAEETKTLLTDVNERVVCKECDNLPQLKDNTATIETSDSMGINKIHDPSNIAQNNFVLPIISTISTNIEENIISKHTNEANVSNILNSKREAVDNYPLVLQFLSRSIEQMQDGKSKLESLEEIKEFSHSHETKMINAPKILSQQSDRNSNIIPTANHRQMSPVAIVPPQPQKVQSPPHRFRSPQSYIQNSILNFTPTTTENNFFSPVANSISGPLSHIASINANNIYTATNEHFDATNSFSICTQDNARNDLKRNSFCIDLPRQQTFSNSQAFKDIPPITVRIGPTEPSVPNQYQDSTPNLTMNVNKMDTEECVNISLPASSHNTNIQKLDTLNNKGNENKQWECGVCKKSFTTKYFLKKHNRLHTGETPYTCGECGKTFTFQQSYHKHVLYHSDEKPHRCTYCGRSFKEMSTLHNHIRIHTGEKPFNCETCGKSFRQRVSYLVHQRIHTGVLPYACDICQRAFRYKVSLRSHKCDGKRNVNLDSEELSTSHEATIKASYQIQSADASNLPSTSRSEEANLLQQENNNPLSIQPSYSQIAIHNPIIQQIYEPLIRSISSYDAANNSPQASINTGQLSNPLSDTTSGLEQKRLNQHLIDNSSTVQEHIDDMVKLNSINDCLTAVNNINLEGNPNNKSPIDSLEGMAQASMETESDSEVFLKTLFS